MLLDALQLHQSASLHELVPILVFVEVMALLAEHHVIVTIVLKPHTSLRLFAIEAPSFRGRGGWVLTP